MNQNLGSIKGIMISLMILSGTVNTIAYKFQNKQIIHEGPYYRYFFHPYMQAVAMFLGETLVLGLYYLKKSRDPQGYKTRLQKAKSEGKQIKVNKLIFLIPAACDFITSTLQHIALNFVAGSVYQMMRGGSIVTTFMFSVLFLKTKIKRHQIFGSVCTIVGITIVGFSNLYYSQSNSDSTKIGLTIMGYILIFISLFSVGFYFVFQQKLLHKYHLQPLEIVGWEGVFGLCIYSVALPIMSYIPCNFGLDACVFIQSGAPYIQNPRMYFLEWMQSGILTTFCIVSIFSIVMFNISGVSVTKYINALARSICDVTRTILVWMISIIITLTLGKTYVNYRWEIVGVAPICVEAVGFVALVFGNLAYNQYIKIPYIHQKQKPLQSLLLTEQEGLGSTVNKKQFNI